MLILAVSNVGVAAQNLFFVNIFIKYSLSLSVLCFCYGCWILCVQGNWGRIESLVAPPTWDMQEEQNVADAVLGGLWVQILMALGS